MSESEITFRVLDRDVPNPAHDGRHRHSPKAIETFRAGSRFRLEIRPYTGMEREGFPPDVVAAEARVRWGHIDVIGSARRPVGGGEWSFNPRSGIDRLVEASHAVPPVGYAEERDAMDLDESDDSVLLRLLWEDVEAKPLVMAAMAALAARRLEEQTRADTEIPLP